MFKKKEKDIYYKYADEMYSLCYRYIGDSEISEELLNDGFIKVFKNLKRFKQQGKNSFKYWIKRIMINECLMFLRKKKLKSIVWIENVSEEKINHFDNTSIDDKLIEKGEIDELIKELPIGYRTVFNLYAIEGYSHKEISEKLKIQESTSRSQLTMARNKLQEMLLKKGISHG